MSSVLHHRPAAMEQLLSQLRPNPDQPDTYAAEVDLTADQVKELALFEVASRNGRVCFSVPGRSQVLTGCMNPLVGLGAATAAEYAARIRISFHDVRNAKLVEAG
jgi:hypothetical protein